MDKFEIDILVRNYFEACVKVRKPIIEFIKSVVDKAKDKSISFYDDEDYDGEYCYVTYDGGRHPEYASGYEKASRVYYNSEHNGYYVSCETGDEELHNFSTDDLTELYDFVNYTLTECHE